MSSQDTNNDIELESPKPHIGGASQKEISMPGNVNSTQQLENIPEDYLNVTQVCNILFMFFV